MCGICGVVQVGGEPRELVSPEQLDDMTDVMTHRGPNDRGTYAAPGIALGVRGSPLWMSKAVTSRS
jgi:asparagine synthetase B (glutamine-hydrolysing)